MLTSHCTSLELSLALREAGYPQENALFYWYRQEEYYGAGVLQPAGEPFLDRYVAEPSFPVKRLAAAPLTSELLEQEEMKGYTVSTTWFKEPEKHAVCQWYDTHDTDEAPYKLPCYGNTLPDAAARTYIHLRQEQLI